MYLFYIVNVAHREKRNSRRFTTLSSVIFAVGALVATLLLHFDEEPESIR